MTHRYTSSAAAVLPEPKVQAARHHCLGSMEATVTRASAQHAKRRRNHSVYRLATESVAEKKRYLKSEPLLRHERQTVTSAMVYK